MTTAINCHNSRLMDDCIQPSCEEAPGNFYLCRTVGLFTGDMRRCRKWVSRQNVMIQLLDWMLRGMAQVMFVNNPVSGLLITAGLFLQNPWWALNSLLGTLVSTASAIFLGQNREAISAGLYGYNGALVGMLMAVFSARGNWYWWLLLPNMFMSMLCPVVSSALSTVASKWDLPIFTLPFNILVCLHMAATAANHPYFPQVYSSPATHKNKTEAFHSQLFLSVPVGVGQVYGCDSPWTGGVILLGLLLSSPTICLHAMLGSAAGVLTGLALAAPLRDIYSGLWGYNSALSCIAVGGVFYVITWQTHLLAVICALFSAYMTSASSRLMSVLALPACTWPFCLSTLIFLLFSSEIPAICRLPLSVVSYPEENLRNRRRLKASQAVRRSEQGSGQEEEEEKAPPKENTGTDYQSVEERGSV
ncbi:urea transporter 1-like [Pleuronectes platessa]|uniref:urea transporter 1-like n=1 Tax=Pleuronectes platessa TaxID=8262 RepID=UPI00232A3A24|nr:urea transporter 1-like [Pleuronectes platessa]